MKLNEIYEQMESFLDKHPEVYEINDEGQDIEVMEEFDKLQDKIFNDNQTYFTWDVDNDTFRIDRAFGTVLDYLKDKNKKVKDHFYGYTYVTGEAKLILLIETED